MLGPSREPLRSNSAIGLSLDVEANLPVNSTVIIVGAGQPDVQDYMAARKLIADRNARVS